MRARPSPRRGAPLPSRQYLALPPTVMTGVCASLAHPTVRVACWVMADSPRRLWELPSWLLAEAARRGHGLVSDGISAEGVRKAHFNVLLSLDEHGPSSQAELGRRLRIDRSDMVAVINDLEHAGLVER